jgi:hypothetical protein
MTSKKFYVLSKKAKLSVELGGIISIFWTPDE